MSPGTFAGNTGPTSSPKEPLCLAKAPGQPSFPENRRRLLCSVHMPPPLPNRTFLKGRSPPGFSTVCSLTEVIHSFIHSCVRSFFSPHLILPQFWRWGGAHTLLAVGNSPWNRGERVFWMPASVFPVFKIAHFPSIPQTQTWKALSLCRDRYSEKVRAGRGGFRAMRSTRKPFSVACSQASSCPIISCLHPHCLALTGSHRGRETLAHAPAH